MNKDFKYRRILVFPALLAQLFLAVMVLLEDSLVLEK
jgi:hypothetical protein